MVIANVNFMGFELEKAGKLNNWKERESFPEKIKKVFGALGIEVKPDERPFKSMGRIKDLRDKFAHGKSVYADDETEEIGTPEEVQKGSDLLAGWEPECMLEPTKEAFADMDALWKLMVEKSGLQLWGTITRGERTVTFISEVE